MLSIANLDSACTDLAWTADDDILKQAHALDYHVTESRMPWCKGCQDMASADLHDHEGDAVWVRPAGTLEGHCKVDVGHVWIPDAHI